VAISKVESHLADARVYMLTHPKEFDMVCILYTCLIYLSENLHPYKKMSCQFRHKQIRIPLTVFMITNSIISESPSSFSVHVKAEKGKKINCSLV
jgi:hypothetical protein